MLTVYRVEHVKTKMGPFQTPDPFTQKLAKLAANNVLLRSPIWDNIVMSSRPYHWVFGCLDLPSLKRWIYQGGSIQENDAIVLGLKERGFQLAEYLVDPEDMVVGASKLQVLFDAQACVYDDMVEYHNLSVLLREGPYVFCDFARIDESLSFM